MLSVSETLLLLFLWASSVMFIVIFYNKKVSVLKSKSVQNPNSVSRAEIKNEPEKKRIDNEMQNLIHQKEEVEAEGKKLAEKKQKIWQMDEIAVKEKHKPEEQIQVLQG